MALFLCCRFLLLLAFVSCVCLGAGVNGYQNLVFSLNNFGKDSNFELFGDAKVVNGSSNAVQIAGSGVNTAGRVVFKKPISLVVGKSGALVSFSSYFVFSISGDQNGDGLTFVMVPDGFPLSVFDGGPMGMLLGERKIRFLAIEFDAFRDEKYGDVNGNHVGIDVDSPVSLKVGNVSSINLVLSSGEELQAWIDYEASGKRFEVRLSKFGEKRPVNPLLTYPIDLSKMWKNETFTLGLSSSSGRNSSQKSNLYSWSFESRTMPHWMHSQPLDPESVSEKGEERKASKKSDCALRILGALIFGTGCGALGAFLVLFLWTMFGNRRPVAPEEFTGKTESSDRYKKIDVAGVDKTIEDGKKVVGV